MSNLLTPLALTVISGVMLYDHVPPRLRSDAASPPPSPSSASPTGSGVSLGQAYAPVLIAGYADAWLAAANELEAGKPISEAQKTLQETWKATRISAFARDVQPGFSLVLPEGTEPADPAKRAQVAELWRSFARGLKGGH